MTLLEEAKHSPTLEFSLLLIIFFSFFLFYFFQVVRFMIDEKKKVIKESLTSTVQVMQFDDILQKTKKKTI